MAKRNVLGWKMNGGKQTTHAQAVRDMYRASSVKSLAPVVHPSSSAHPSTNRVAPPELRLLRIDLVDPPTFTLDLWFDRRIKAVNNTGWFHFLLNLETEFGPFESQASSGVVFPGGNGAARITFPDLIPSSFEVSKWQITATPASPPWPIVGYYDNAQMKLPASGSDDLNVVVI